MAHNVLLVTYYWPPSGGAGVQRILKFAKYLPRFGVHPIVLTVSNPTYPVLDESLNKEVPGDLPVYRTCSPEPFSLYGRMSGKTKQEVAQPTRVLKEGKSLSSKVATWIRANLFIPDARMGWYLTAKRKAIKLVEAYNISAIVTTGPPHSVHFVGHHVKKSLGIPWISDFRDPWTQIHYNQLLPRTRLAKSIDLALERKVLAKADNVLVVSPSMAKLQKQIYKRQYEVIPNGFDPDNFRNIPQPQQRQEQFVIRHVGSVSENSVPYGFFEALSQITARDKLRIEFIGQVHPKVQKLIAEYNLEDMVSLKGYVPHSEAIGLMQNADMLLLSIPRVLHNELILTGKLFDYLASRTPILMLGPTEGDAAHIISELKAGQAFEHNDIDHIQQTLESALQNVHRAEQNESPAAFDLEQHPYSRITLTEQLAGLIKNP